MGLGLSRRERGTGCAGGKPVMPRLLGLLIFALATFASAASAQPRPSTTDMACSQAAALVRSQGAVLLGTGGATFDRFVSTSQFCSQSERTEPAFAPSRDVRQCFVGYRCRERSSDVRGNE